MRLNLIERREAMSDVNGHYEETLLLHPGWEIEPGFGLLQLRALQGTYDALETEIEAIEATGMPLQRAQRDGLFGTSPEDVGGLWYFLSLYKAQVRLKLPKNSPFAKTTPNIGNVSPGAYDAILRRFGEHWKLVNEALATQTPPALPLGIGPITLEELESRRARIQVLEDEVDETVLTKLAVMRAQREALYGDVREDEREPTSLIARYEMYRLKVQSELAGTPFAATLPRIFPDETAGQTKFDFNFKASGSSVTVWFTMPDVTNAALVYLKEGAFEETVAIPVGVAMKVVFSGVSVQGDVDEVELRDAAGKTVAFGKFDGALIEPV